MHHESENIIGAALRDVRAIRAVAIHYGEAWSEGCDDAMELWDALYTLIERLEEDLKRQLDNVE